MTEAATATRTDAPMPVRTDLGTVSVIIPAYNSEDSLERTIRSVLEQTYAPSEVFVINDGSTDNTEAVARKFEPRVRYLSQENKGQGAARNLGLAAASGDFIAFLDADDYWMPLFIEKCLLFLADHPEAIAVSCGFISKHWGKSDYGWPPLDGSRDRDVPASRMIENFFEFWAANDHIRTGSNMIRRSAIQRIGGQNEGLRVSQDLEYWALLGTAGPWGVIPDRLFVTDGSRTAGRHGWITKYSKRRKLCPSVDQWQERIEGRISEKDWPHFRVVRGRVASNFALNRILAGDSASARQIVRNYGSEMKPNRTTRTMRIGDRLGAMGWKAACALIHLRETVKSMLISASYRKRKS